MLNVYFLPVEDVAGTESVAGVELIHDAILETTADPAVRKLLMDTTLIEHIALIQLALSFRLPTPEEIANYQQTVVIPPPNPDTLRAQELLASSASVITQPEVWELLRILGRRLGYRFP